MISKPWQAALLVVLTAGMTFVAGAEGAQAQSAEPELKPGIPGLKMADVRAHNHLWRELEELQEWEVGDRITIAEFRGKSIEKTAQYLGFEAAAGETFGHAALAVLVELRAASRASKRAELTMEASEKVYRAGLDAAVVRMTALLEDRPRHHVFEPKLKLWLLKLALGPSEAEEAREAKAAAISAAPAPGS